MSRQLVLRRDRAVIVAALVVITGLAWAYVLWLANDMAMGGMDMTGFPDDPGRNGVDDAGVSTMAANRIHLHVCDVGSDDDRHDDAIGRPHGPALCARRPTGGDAGQALC